MAADAEDARQFEFTLGQAHRKNLQICRVLVKDIVPLGFPCPAYLFSQAAQGRV